MMNNQQSKFPYPLLLQGFGLALLVHFFPILLRVILRACRMLFSMLKTLAKILSWLMLPVTVILFIYWLLQPKRKDTRPSAQDANPEPQAVRGYAAIFDVPAQKVELSQTPADDLKLINGIGPVIARMLEENGIRTFVELSHTQPERLSQILETAGLKRLANPATWPEQARLAAAGDWDGFQYLQNQIKSTRKN